MWKKAFEVAGWILLGYIIAMIQASIQVASKSQDLISLLCN